MKNHGKLRHSSQRQLILCKVSVSMEGREDTGPGELYPGSGAKVWQDFVTAARCDQVGVMIAPQTRKGLARKMRQNN